MSNVEKIITKKRSYEEALKDYENCIKLMKNNSEVMPVALRALAQIDEECETFSERDVVIFTVPFGVGGEVFRYSIWIHKDNYEQLYEQLAVYSTTYDLRGLLPERKRGFITEVIFSKICTDLTFNIMKYFVNAIIKEFDEFDKEKIFDDLGKIHDKYFK